MPISVRLFTYNCLNEVQFGLASEVYGPAQIPSLRDSVGYSELLDNITSEWPPCDCRGISQLYAGIADHTLSSLNALGGL